MTTCTRCDSSGFLNLDFDFETHDEVLKWIKENDNHDVTVCDCCGDGDEWYGVHGEHYGPEDPPGPNGPYAYNGGLCECN